LILSAALALGVIAAQGPDPLSLPPRPNEEEPKRLPDGRLQSEAIIKDELKRNLADIEKMNQLLAEVKTDMEKNEGHVLSLGSVKKLEELEKLSKKIRGRMLR
jgi:hypothetical protein